MKSDVSRNCVDACKLLTHVSFLYFQAQAVKRAKSEQPSLESKNKCSSKDKELVQSNMDENRTEAESLSNSDSKDGGKRASPDVEQTEVEEQNDLPKECKSETESKEEKTATKNTNNKKAEKRRDAKKTKHKDHKQDTNEKKEEDKLSGNSGDIEMASNEEEKKHQKKTESEIHNGEKEDVDRDDKEESAKSGKTKQKGSTSITRTKDEIKTENKGDEKKEPPSKNEDDKNEKKKKGGLSDFFCKYNLFYKNPHLSFLAALLLPPPPSLCISLEILVVLATFL